MTDTLRKRAERQRKREAGEVRVEVWIPSDQLATLDHYCEHWACTRSGAIQGAVGILLAGYKK